MKNDPLKIALFSAAAFEVAPLIAWMEKAGIDYLYHPVGVGALAAAKDSENLRRFCADRHALFVGTCGTFGPFDQPALVTAKTVHWLPTCERAGLSYAIVGTAPAITIAGASLFAEALPRVSVLCAPNVSLTPTLPAGFSPSECVENIELYSCTQPLIDSALSLSIILCTTNAVGIDAHRQWKSNFAAAAEISAEFVSRRLGR